MVIKPEIEGMNIVFRGDFNPKIFQPAWFAAQDLIRNEEANEAKIEVIHATIAVFRLDWLEITVEPNRFYAATTLNPYFDILKDLVLGTFRLLSHTPIDKIGINYDSHFKIESEEKWHGLGHKLAPKDVWDKILIKPGLSSLAIKGERSDEYKGNITVRTEPSSRVRPHGVYISVNDHYELEESHNELGCNAILEILETNWKNSCDRARTITDTILENV